MFPLLKLELANQIVLFSWMTSTVPLEVSLRRSLTRAGEMSMVCESPPEITHVAYDIPTRIDRMY